MIYHSGAYIGDGHLKFPQPDKAYLETSCQEWDQYPEEKKVLDLGYLITHGFDLQQYVKKYLAARPNNKVYVLNAFVEHISFLRDSENGDAGILQLAFENKITISQAVELFCEEVTLRYEQRDHYANQSLAKQIIQQLKILPPRDYPFLRELKLSKKAYEDICKLSTFEYMQRYVHYQLVQLLDSLQEGFDGDELAYLSAHTKNEQPIRDKIAWRLHQRIGPEDKEDNVYVVRREWAPKEAKREQGKVDLAVLEMDSTKTHVVRVIAMIEFKAQSIVKKENWYLDGCKRDIEKMRNFINHHAICKEADSYFVFLETGQDREAQEYKAELGFAPYQTRRMKYRPDKDYLAEIKSHWDLFPGALGKPVAIHEPKAIYIGQAFGYKQYVSPLLIGPL